MQLIECTAVLPLAVISSINKLKRSVTHVQNSQVLLKWTMTFSAPRPFSWTASSVVKDGSFPSSMPPVIVVWRAWNLYRGLISFPSCVTSFLALQSGGTYLPRDHYKVQFHPLQLCGGLGGEYICHGLISQFSVVRSCDLLEGRTALISQGLSASVKAE